MRALFAAAVLALTLGLGASAAAGGWAVTTFDQLPDGFVAGQTYDLGWTIRQHGMTPINVSSFPGGATTAIRASSASGQTLTFTGTQSGPTGHYVAKVSFPAAGEWTWVVTQGPFGEQPLGVLSVTAAAAIASAAPVAPLIQAAPAMDPFRLALPFASGAAAALFVALLALYLRGGRAARVA